MPTQIDYPGTELDLFATASNWKSYWGKIISPYLAGEVLEVGAGLGANTQALISTAPWTAWTCLEPDPILCRRMTAALATLPDSGRITITNGLVADLPRQSIFDAALYLDTLEHIADDRAEIGLLDPLLRPGGYLIILAPAHQFLFSAFDAKIGHHRRYDRRSLTAAIPSCYQRVRLAYIDSLGLLLSLGNRLLLRQSTPSEAQIRFWDQAVVPVSRRLDRLTGDRVGKSLLGIWRKPAEHQGNEGQ
jgi:SAM-dependent methyltransferase